MEEKKTVEEKRKMVKFVGRPLQEIKSKATGKIMFVFDTKGEYITDDIVIIGRATGFFDSMEMYLDEAKPVGKLVKKTHKVEPIKIEVNR